MTSCPVHGEHPAVQTESLELASSEMHQPEGSSPRAWDSTAQSWGIDRVTGQCPSRMWDEVLLAAGSQARRQ